jgi:hypothetical protein
MRPLREMIAIGRRRSISLGNPKGQAVVGATVGSKRLTLPEDAVDADQRFPCTGRDSYARALLAPERAIGLLRAACRKIDNNRTAIAMIPALTARC